jgi:hypothetical protein
VGSRRISTWRRGKLRKEIRKRKKMRWESVREGWWLLMERVGREKRQQKNF